MAGHTAYNISKMGMTMVAMGVAEENLGDNITGNSLWPATVIESLASINFKLGELFYLLFWGGLLFFFFRPLPAVPSYNYYSSLCSVYLRLSHQ